MEIGMKIKNCSSKSKRQKQQNLWKTTKSSKHFKNKNEIQNPFRCLQACDSVRSVQDSISRTNNTTPLLFFSSLLFLNKFQTWIVWFALKNNTLTTCIRVAFIPFTRWIGLKIWKLSKKKLLRNVCVNAVVLYKSHLSNLMCGGRFILRTTTAATTNLSLRCILDHNNITRGQFVIELYSNSLPMSSRHAKSERNKTKKGVTTNGTYVWFLMFLLLSSHKLWCV